MSGALAPEDAGGARVKPLTGRKRAALSRIVRNADHDKVIEALKARRDAALAAEKGTLILTEPAAQQHKRDAALDNVTAQNPTIQATPRAKAFMLGGSNIKRRPRQPSLLQLVQAQANPQESDDDHLDDDHLDDFHPDDESTPFLHPKTQLLTQSSPSPSPVSSVNQSSSRKRKLSSPVVQVRRSQSLETHASTPKTSSETPESDLEEVYNLPFPSSHHNDHPEPSLPLPKSPQIPHSKHLPLPKYPQIPHSKQWSDIYAPPQSSSPSSHELRNEPLPKRSRPLKPLSTANLLNVLPKRRARPDLREPDPFELPSSSDVEIDTWRLSADADELSVAAKPKVRAKKVFNSNNQNPTSAKPPLIKKKAPRKGGGGGSKDDKTAKPQKNPPVPKKPKTYARTDAPTTNNNNAHEIDNENDDSDLKIISKPPSPPPATTELQRLAHYFQKVDRWKLEFEPVDVTSSASEGQWGRKASPESLRF